MRTSVDKLAAIANKKSRKIIGLMSGTSLDGLDVALCELSGNGTSTQLTLTHFKTVPFPETFKAAIREIFAREQISFRKLCLLNPWVARQHADIILACLDEWEISATEIDLLASHGQTVYHAPLSLHGDRNFGNATLQIGDGDHLAVATGIITISDFRQKHIAAGGEGAPLAAYGDYLLFKEESKDVILLNIGGIANFSLIPGKGSKHGMFSTDTGPGNTLMDAWMQQHFPGKSYDDDAMIAKQGKVNEQLLQSLLSHPFFKEPLPKTTGPELFNLAYLNEAVTVAGNEALSVEDVMATLNRLTARSIVDALHPYVSQETEMYISGGGMHNPMVLDFLRQSFPGINIQPTSVKGVDPDAKEAILFAVLANECVAGSAGNFVPGIDNFPVVSMGKISFPD